MFYDYIPQAILLKQWLQCHSNNEQYSCKKTLIFYPQAHLLYRGMEERNAYQRHERRELTFIEYTQGIGVVQELLYEMFHKCYKLSIIIIILYMRKSKHKKLMCSSDS